MSIQIRDMANPDAQAEVRGRIRGLLEAVARYERDEQHDGEAAQRSKERLREEVVALHIALIGYAPTREQLLEVIPE